MRVVVGVPHDRAEAHVPPTDLADDVRVLILGPTAVVLPAVVLPGWVSCEPQPATAAGTAAKGTATVARTLSAGSRMARPRGSVVRRPLLSGWGREGAAIWY